MMGIRTDRPRNAGGDKERARVQYAQRRLNELRAQDVAKDAAWEIIGAELKAGADRPDRSEAHEKAAILRSMQTCHATGGAS